MKIWQGLESIRTPFEAASVAIGMFDGVHVGHQALIRAAVADARAHRRIAVVFTFDRHPAELLAPDRVPGYLSIPRQRDALLEELGVDHLVIARFDTRFRELSPEAFLHFVLAGIIGARAVFVGEDFRFGRNQVGDIDTLREAQARYGFALNILPPVLVEGEKASSTRARQLLRSGDLTGATAVLGHDYVLSGTVVPGQRLGRTLGYPTANLEIERAQVIPADGVYAVWASFPDEESRGERREARGTAGASLTPRASRLQGAQRLHGACSIGVRPAVGGTARTIETYLLDFDGDLYGQTMDVEFVARLREERNFDSLDALKEQMGRDVAQVREILSQAEERG